MGRDHGIGEVVAEIVEPGVESVIRGVEIDPSIPGRVGLETVRLLELGEQFCPPLRHTEDHGVGKIAAENVNAFLETQLVRLGEAQIELETTRLDQGS